MGAHAAVDSDIIICTEQHGDIDADSDADERIIYYTRLKCSTLVLRHAGLLTTTFATRAVRSRARC